jgi:hypothetical protein|tara:strand:- start:63 stop:236 length:174 start_codon:yes stop_codon:yes gene_type:complete
MQIPFKPPKPQHRTADRKMISVSIETHDIIMQLAKKYELSMTRMTEAIVEYHDENVK